MTREELDEIKQSWHCTRDQSCRLIEALEAVWDGGCQYAGPGRGDCEHAIGLPGRWVSGQHDGPDLTVDAYGRPNGWCWSCWNTYQRDSAFKEGLALTVEKEGMQIEIERLRAEMELERMRLAACGAVAMANTPESAKAIRGGMRDDFKSASCDDVARAVDREMVLRGELNALKADVQEWLCEGCLVFLRKSIPT